MRPSTLILSLFCVCLVLPSAAGAEDGEVIDWGGCPVTPPPMPPQAEGLGENEISVESGRAEVTLNGDATFTGDILLRNGDRLLRAEGATFDRETSTLQVTGEAEFRNEELRVSGSDARFSEAESQISFTDASFDIWNVPARGTAERLVVKREGKVKMREVSYTACPPGHNDWVLKAEKLTVDRDSGVARAQNARMEVYGVPIFWLPVVSYPVTNQRKSGFLIPDVGNSERRGFDIATPWYWNIAPNYDATIIPRLMTERGLQMGGEFRYLRPSLGGILTGEYLADDDKTGKNRSLIAIQHQQALPWGWRGSVEGIDVSDSNYFEDFSSGLASTSQVSLDRRVDFDFYNGPWTALLRVQDYQIIDDTLTSDEKPYKRLPQFVLRGHEPDGLLGFDYRLISELGYFDRDVGATGFRAHLNPEIGRPVDFGFLRFEPGVGLDYTRYSLENTQPDETDDPQRTVPILSLDMRSTFERMINKDRFLQTLEPRVLYTYIPNRNQDDMPVFDTIEPDLNIVQLYRTNRFIGYDRLSDANQVAIGLTTRIIRAETGVEFLRATVGQLRYLSDSHVTLPGEEPIDETSSDYVAEVGTRFANYWRFNLGYQWNTGQTDTQKAEASLRYRRGDTRIGSLSYRYRKSLLQEVDAVLAWPLAEHWNFVGRFNFSIRGSEPLERFAGLEYETCCWAVRAVWRRYLTRRNGESDTSIGFQFVLKGFGDPGTAAEALLDHGILGYE